MNAGKVSLLRSQSDARGFIDKTRTLSTIICKKIFHWKEAMLRRCSRFVAVTSSAFLSLCASAPMVSLVCASGATDGTKCATPGTAATGVCMRK